MESHLALQRISCSSVWENGGEPPREKTSTKCRPWKVKQHVARLEIGDGAKIGLRSRPRYLGQPIKVCNRARVPLTEMSTHWQFSTSSSCYWTWLEGSDTAGTATLYSGIFLCKIADYWARTSGNWPVTRLHQSSNIQSSVIHWSLCLQSLCQGIS